MLVFIIFLQGGMHKGDDDVYMKKGRRFNDTKRPKTNITSVSNS
jgi:hypothetical protein